MCWSSYDRGSVCHLVYPLELITCGHVLFGWGHLGGFVGFPSDILKCYLLLLLLFTATFLPLLAQQRRLDTTEDPICKQVQVFTVHQDPIGIG